MNLTPLQVNAASGLLKNQGLTANTSYNSGYAIYLSSDLIRPLVETIEYAKANANAVLAQSTISSLTSLSTECPPLCDGGKILLTDTSSTSNIYTTLGVVSLRDKLIANIIPANVVAKPGANMSKCFSAVTSISITSSDPNVSVSGTANTIITANANCVANCLIVGDPDTPLADYTNLAVPPPTVIEYTDFDLIAKFKNNDTQFSSVSSTTMLISDFCVPGDKRWKCNCWATADKQGNFVADLHQLYLGRGDYTIFVQAYNQAQGYIAQSNQFIGGADLGQSYLYNTFNGMSDLITGSISSINPNIKGFAGDLLNLGKLINMNTLEDLGSPLGLVRQIVNVVGYLPVLSIAFLAVGIPQNAIGAIGDPNANVTDATQKLMYKALGQIKESAFEQILRVLQIKTTGFETAADLLNPVFLFPNSYTTMKTQTPDGYQPIYINNQGGVNSALETKLPAYVLRSTA